MHTNTILAFALLVASSAPASAQFAASAGFSNTAFPVAAPGAPIGGLTRLPSGNLAVFDGSRVAEIDPQHGGALVRVLYTPPAPVFGSFLATDPTGTFVLFGESSFGTIERIPLDGSTSSRLTTLAFNYDAAFDGAGSVYVTHGNTTWTATNLVRVDLASGATTLVANVPGPSGPLTFDANGNLLYGENSLNFPAPAGSGTIYAFSALQLASADGQLTLTDGDAMQVAIGLGAISDLLVDAEGDLVVADSAKGTIVTLHADGTHKATLGVPTSSHTGVTALAFIDDGAAHVARFDAFQPPAGGLLAALVSDFATTNDVHLISPKRARFEVTPPNPVPIGVFAVDLVDGPEQGFALLLIAASASPQEVVAVVNEVPFFFALLPPTIVALGIVPLDAAGSLTLPTTNPGIGASISIQAALLSPMLEPLGTSEPFTLTLR